MSANAFTNTIVLVTGAASGIGRELTLQSAARGANVVATDINSGELAQTRQLAESKGWNITTMALDVADKKAIYTFASGMIPSLQNRKLILINNAGVGLVSGKFEDTQMEDFEWLVNINLWGTIYMTKAFYPYLLERNEGHIVNISSVFGLAGVERNVPYCTSKFGVRGFTESLRMELLGTNIHTTCVHPGGIKTNIVKNAHAKGSILTKEKQKQSIVRFEQQARTTPAAAAEAILNAVAKKKARLLIGPDGKAMDLLTRLFPIKYTRIIHRQIRKTFGLL